ncbi:hypothetical protein Salat_1193000 [Sesamum alatum]|uniref:Uncharacterized protein n=1 Tax=Sesamum alatum TaxID=300844 RepID=A0AAE2CNQ5_9LAMI|nr:hypothetical protein Salat_1193000 [Sesamum alatum]
MKKIRQQERINTSATHSDVQELALGDKTSRQDPHLTHGIPRKEELQTQVEGMQICELDTCRNETSNTGVNKDTLDENMVLEVENQELIPEISKNESNINILLSRDRIVEVESTPSGRCIPPSHVEDPSINKLELAQKSPSSLIYNLVPELQTENGTNAKPQKQTTSHEPESNTDRRKQQHGASILTIHNPDPGSTITKHTTKSDKSVLPISAQHADNTTSSSCATDNNNRITDDEFPPGFEPGFKFQSSNVTNTCSKPKRQRGRPKLTRQSPSKEQSDQARTHFTTTILQFTQENLFWRRMQQRTVT